MATQPKPHEPPPPPHPHPPEPKPEAAKASGYAEPEHVRTVADEQRERSEEMQKEGVDAWKAKHDERTPEEREGKPVTGVQPGPNTARAAQHPAASR